MIPLLSLLFLVITLARGSPESAIKARMCAEEDFADDLIRAIEHCDRLGPYYRYQVGINTGFLYHLTQLSKLKKLYPTRP